MTAMPKLVRYLLGGLLIGAFWYINRGRPLWEEALRTIVVFAALITALKAKLRRSSVNVHVVPLLASKAVLVVIAAVVEQVLEHRMTDPSNAVLFVAPGLAVAVALLGPVADRYFFSRMELASQAPAAVYEQQH